MSTGSPRAPLAATLLAVLSLVACTTEPLPTPDTAPSVPSSPTPDELDADEEALAAQVAAVAATVEALRTALDDAAEGDAEALERAGRLLAADLEAASDADVARAAADDTTDGDADADPGPAVTDDDPSDDDGDPSDDDDAAARAGGELAPLLPGPVSSRETTVSYGDLLTTTLAAARGAGRAGEPVARFLATPLAGDVGAWQRSPADLLALIADAGTTSDVDRAAEAVLALDGEAARALAWVVHGLTTDTDVADVASRASAHLAIIERALQDLS